MTLTSHGGIHIGAALGDFPNFDPPIDADYTTTTPADGCTAITNDVTGKIALIDRGVCSFTTKIRNARAPAPRACWSSTTRPVIRRPWARTGPCPSRRSPRPWWARRKATP